MSPPFSDALPMPRAASLPRRASNEPVSLAGVQELDAAVLSFLVRVHGAAAADGHQVCVVDVAPGVARMLRTLGLTWMLDGRSLDGLVAANEPMDRASA